MERPRLVNANLLNKPEIQITHINNTKWKDIFENNKFRSIFLVNLFGILVVCGICYIFYIARLREQNMENYQYQQGSQGIQESQGIQNIFPYDYFHHW